LIIADLKGHDKQFVKRKKLHKMNSGRGKQRLKRYDGKIRAFVSIKGIVSRKFAILLLVSLESYKYSTPFLLAI
jgi:hypothetical protein